MSARNARRSGTAERRRCTISAVRSCDLRGKPRSRARVGRSVAVSRQAWPLPPCMVPGALTGEPLRGQARGVSMAAPVSPAIVVDLAAEQLKIDGRPIGLRPKTWEVLRVLAERPGQL